MKNNYLATFKFYEICRFLLFFKRKRLVKEKTESYFATQRYAKWLAVMAAKGNAIAEISLRNLDDEIVYKKKIVAGCAGEWEQF